MKMSNRQKTKFIIWMGSIITILLLGAGGSMLSLVHRAGDHYEKNRTMQSSLSESISKKDASISSSETVQDTESSTGYSNLPTQVQTDAILKKVAYALKTPVYNGYGAYTVNNNKSTLTAKNSTQQFAANTVDKQGRPTVSNAFLTKASRQYSDRESTGNGASDWTPAGYHQLSDLTGTYRYAYNRGHLLGYALVGNIKGFDASESNKKNIVTQTSWANQAQSATNTGQNYYEGLVRQALDQNKKVRYQVTAMYGKDTTNMVPYGTHIQAKSTDGTLNFNVFVPNVQGNITIDYATGYATANQ